GWANFGAGVKNVDQNFETFTSAVTNQGLHDDNAYLNVTRLAWFPLNFKADRKTTVTPNAYQSGNSSSLVSVLQQGRVDETTFSGVGTLQLPRFPKLGLLYDDDVTKTTDLFRTDKTRHYGTTLDYTVPKPRWYIPRTMSLGYKLTDYELDYGDEARIDPTQDPLL